MGTISSKEAYKLYGVSRQSKNDGITADGFYQQKGFEKTMEQIAELPLMSSTFPIIILSSIEMNKSAPTQGDWHALQKQWLNQNPNSTILRAHGGHFVHHEQPNLACNQVNKLVQTAVQTSIPDRWTTHKTQR